MDEEYVLAEDTNYEFSPDDIDAFDLDFSEFGEQDGVEYPAVLLDHVLFMDALRILKIRKKKSYREMDVWVLLADGQYQHIGAMQIDSDTLIVLKHLRIGVTLYFAKGDCDVLDLNNPAVLERFI